VRLAVAVEVGPTNPGEVAGDAAGDLAEVGPAAVAITAVVHVDVHGAGAADDEVVRFAIAVEVGEPDLVRVAGDATGDLAEVGPAAVAVAAVVEEDVQGARA